LQKGGEVEDEERGQKFTGNETVLLVEDDPSIRLLAETALAELGYKVILAHDGMHAIDKFKENRETVDIVVMDMVMPKKSGMEAYQEIKKLQPETKVLFMSGYSQDLLRNKGIINTGEEVIIKPVQPTELARKVRCMLDG
jgi:DNA-binding response OmpR family regulator